MKRRIARVWLSDPGGTRRCGRICSDLGGWSMCACISRLVVLGGGSGREMVWIWYIVDYRIDQRDASSCLSAMILSGQPWRVIFLFPLPSG